MMQFQVSTTESIALQKRNLKQLVLLPLVYNTTVRDKFDA